MKSRQWSTFLRIPEPNTSDFVPVLDPGWCAARGVNPAAEVVLRLLRDEVLPLIRALEKRHGLESYHFMIHDRTSGVPTDEKDRSAFIHLRLFFKKLKKDFYLEFSTKFEMTRPTSGAQQESVGGIDSELIDAHSFSRLLHMQSAWVLALVEAHDWSKSDVGSMVRQCLQFGHYFSNMLQMSFR